MGKSRVIVVSALSAALIAIGAFISPVQAETSSSTSYKLDATVGNSLGGQTSSGSYQLVNSGGESVIGNGASGSYIIGQGYTSRLEQSFQLTAPTSLSLGVVSADTSNTVPATLSVTTDAPGYTLSTQQDHDLQNGTNFIPAVSGSIGSPVTWTEGITKGLGFSLVSTNATAIPAKWLSGNAYAAVPSNGTGFYTRTDQNAGSADNLNIRFRLDVNTSQPTGIYSNTVTWTGTMTP